ncbi:MAG: hypothetical protein K0V04_10615, partial [Deltaproteobacteria bacterium]|nr:hypothetical protein [Deltaproteobacteria bacterium]
MMSSSRSVARVTQLSSATPLADAEVQLFRAKPSLPVRPIGEPGRTDARGIASLPDVGSTPRGSGLVLVRSGAGDDRFVMGPHVLERLGKGPGKGFAKGESVLASVVTERPLYRPGETIHVVGWATVSTPHTSSGLRPVPKRTKVEIALLDRFDEVVIRRTVAVKDYGKFWVKLALAEDLRLGRYTVQAKVAETTANAHVRLRRFRTPPFAVDAGIDQGDVVHGATPKVTAGASYYFGGRVPIAHARQNNQCSPTRFRPPGLEPQWVVGAPDEPWPSMHSWNRSLTVDPEQEGRVDYTIDLSRLETAWPYRCLSSVAIQDAAAAEVGAEARVTVHPSRYLLMALPTKRVEVGDSVSLPIRSVDHQAARTAPVPVTVRVQHRYWDNNAKGRWVERERTLPRCRVKTTAEGDDPVCRLGSLERGSYTIEAATTDGPPATIERTLWVGPRWKRPSSTKPKGLEIEVSDPEPRPGDIVTVTVRSAASSGAGVIALMHGGLRTVEPFQLRDGRHEHTFTVVDAWVPSVEVEAVLVHPATATREALVETDTARLRVSAEHRALQVEVTAPDVSAPRDTIPIALTLRDAAGDPVAGHVALWAVDEAVLSLAEPVMPDLVAAFVVDAGRQTDLRHSYDERMFPYVKRADPYEFGWGRGFSASGYGRGGGGTGSGFGHGAGSMAGKSPTRSNFEATPIFLGDVEVGASGRATANGTLPDNLTTFRITAIASAKLPGGDAVGRFGHADTRVRVTAPLVLQAALPRHLRPGDDAQVAALIDNLGGPAGIVTVQASIDDGDGVATLTSPMTMVERIEAGGQIRVPFRLRALGPGEPRVTLSATLAAEQGDVRLSDAVELPLPIEVERGLIRQVAVYGSLADDEPAAIAMKRPDAARPGAGGVDVALSSTLLGGAEDMVDGLVQYPYGCLEQTSSRLLPLAALGELARHYPLKVGELDSFVRQGVMRLQSMQVGGGGFAYWPGDPHVHVYATAYATWILQMLYDEGYPVPARLLEDLRGFLTERIDDWTTRGTPTAHDDIHLAMALHALAAGGKAPAKALGLVYERRGRLPTFTRAIVLLALSESNADDPRVDTVAQELLSGLDERDGFAHVRDDGRWLSSFFDSGPRTEGMVLLALLHTVPDDRRVKKLARGLMELR